MFTGIIEAQAVVKDLVRDKSNLHITLESHLSQELKIDQSLAHNGVCLTVVAIDLNRQNYTVTAIEETLNKTALGSLKTGDLVNLERGMKIGDRLDGHIVQGHVDQLGQCSNIKDLGGSWVYTFKYATGLNNITIEKGSITINGISLTVVDSKRGQFDVAIIPYTFNNTNFKTLKLNDLVNLEFDVIGKYVARLAKPD